MFEIIGHSCSAPLWRAPKAQRLSLIDLSADSVTVFGTLAIVRGQSMDRGWTPHLWALVVPIVFVVVAFLLGTLLLGYWPAFFRWLIDL